MQVLTFHPSLYLIVKKKYCSKETLAPSLFCKFSCNSIWLKVIFYVIRRSMFPYTQVRIVLEIMSNIKFPFVNLCYNLLQVYNFTCINIIHVFTFFNMKQNFLIVYPKVNTQSVL